MTASFYGRTQDDIYKFISFASVFQCRIYTFDALFGTNPILWLFIVKNTMNLKHTNVSGENHLSENVCMKKKMYKNRIQIYHS